MIPYGHQDISREDIAAVIATLQSEWLTQGPAVERFEQAVAAYCGVKYAVAVSSATAALHLACLAARLGPGDQLWTSPNTFVASANCGRYCGAQVDFVDIDPRTYNLSAVALGNKLSEVPVNQRPKVVVPVHFAGQSCDMAAIQSLARQHGFLVLEDASHAIGGRYRGQPVGCCAYSDMAVFSFHPVKIITTGEGGMVLTNRPDLYERLSRLRTHGITRNPALMTEPAAGPWYYQQIDLGYNYRITDIQCALGQSQLNRLEHMVGQRHRIADRYQSQFQDLPVILPWQHPDTYSSFHLFVIRLKLKEIGKSRRQVFEELRAMELGVNVHYIPVHTQPYYARQGFKPGDFPEAERYYEEAISLPMFSALREDQVERVEYSLRHVLCP